MKEEYLKILRNFYATVNNDEKTNYSTQLKQYQEKSSLKSTVFFYQALIENSKVSPDESKSQPKVGYFCNLVPEEIIISCGALPVRLCSQDSFCMRKGEEMAGGDICPVIKSICGVLQSNKFDDVDLLVIPAACDGKMKLAEILAPFKKVYFLDLPKDSDYLKNTDIWTEKYTQFYEYLKNTYNCKSSRKELLKACEVLNQRTAIFRKIYHLRTKMPLVINTFDYFVMTYVSFFSRPEIWTKYAGEVFQEANQAKSPPADVFNGKRLLLAGAPIIFPNFKILDILDEINCEVAADLICSAYGILYNPVEIDEETEKGILRSISLKYIAATICPCFLGIDKLITGIIDTVKEYNLDGVIYHNLRLCQVYEIHTAALRQILKENKIPFLAIKTDLGKEDTSQIKTRLEAYLEMIG